MFTLIIGAICSGASIGATIGGAIATLTGTAVGTGAAIGERHPYFELFYRNTGGFLSENLDLSRLSGLCVLEEPQSERENREVVFIHQSRYMNTTFR